VANSIKVGAPSAAFEPGRTLSIPIIIELDEPTKVRGIRARFHGAEETKAVYLKTSTDAKGKITVQPETATETTEIVAQDFLLAGAERLGFFGSIKDELATMFGGGQHETMEAGEHPFFVDIRVPNDARPTHAGQKSRVFYELAVQVDIPMGSDLEATREFLLLAIPPREVVTSPVRTCYPDEETVTRGLMDSMFGPNVQLEVMLNANRFRVGDVIEGIVKIKTTEPLNCRAVKAQLVAVESTNAKSRTDSHVHEEPAVELDTPGSIDGEYCQRFSLRAHAQGPVTAKGSRFNVQWFVQVELDVPWSKDPSLRVPIELLPGA
jgi:hypothetical protein